MLDKIMTGNKINDSDMLKNHRNKLIEIDRELIRLLGERMELSSEIGKLKSEHGLDIEQIDFWNESSINRKEVSESCNLCTDFIEELFLLIQKESIRIQRGC
jgi:chorismate mutase